MAEIAPFRALRYDLSRVAGADAGALLAPPYDVVSEAERTALEAQSPYNVIRLELPRGEGDAKYADAGALLERWIADGALRLDPRPAIYVYEQQFRYSLAGAGADDRVYARRGFFCRLRLSPFADRIVLPHEHTLAAPKADRMMLMRATRAQLSQVFGLYRDPAGATAAVLASVDAAAPAFDATTADGCRHRLWPVTDRDRLATLTRALADRQVMIADGHHRYETMLALRDEVRPPHVPPGGAAADWGCVFLARAEDPGLLILPTHRLIRNLPGFDVDELTARAAGAFEVTVGDESDAPAIESRLRAEGRRRVTFALRAAGRAGTIWLGLRADAALSTLGPPALQRLDVTVLHGLVLDPWLGIDAAALARQAYLGYTHDAALALAEVARGGAQAAFLMNATTVDQVLSACEAGFVLPQKSTYFQPKLGTGLVIHRIDGMAQAQP